MTFTLKIKLGNDAMQSPQDVNEALITTGNALLRAGDPFAPIDEADHGRIMDLNGNSVGTWEVK